MKLIAVIAEYNPFHTGHAYLLQQIRSRCGSDAAIAVIMSGSFVQRGEPALFDKWTRARWAVLGGADCVLELPLLFAVSSAPGFASGAVRLAASIGCQAIACGVEDGTARDFETLARTALSIRSLSPENHAGQPYGQYITEALAARCPEQQHLLSSPNSLLALEYTKAICTYSPSVKLLPVLRTGAAHDQETRTARHASASALRQLLVSGRISDLIPYVPPYVYEDIARLYKNGHYTNYCRYHDFVLFANRFLPPEKLRTFPAFTEGLENRWHRIFSAAPTWEEAMSSLKTRRYAYSRLCRMGVYTLLKLPQTHMTAAYKTGPSYGRILAFSQRGRAILRNIRSTLPLLTRVSAARNTLIPPAQALLAYDLRGTDLQSLSMSGSAFRQGCQDYVTSPHIGT